MELSITELMGADYRRLEKLWEECLDGARTFDLRRIRDRFNRFAQGWRRHIRVEEEILFPAYEARAPTGAARAAWVMRAEHREIEAMLERLTPLMTARDHSTIAVTLEGQPCCPTVLFQSHEAKEEDVVYPMMDGAFADDERSKLLEQARELLTAESG